MTINHYLSSPEKKQTRSVSKTSWNVKKQWLYSRELIGLLVSSKILVRKKNASKLVRIDLSRKTNTNISQQVNFVGRLEQNIGAKEIFIAEKQQETIWNFSLDLLESAK